VYLNNNNIDSNQDVICKYSETLTQPLLDNPKDYYMTLVRWQLSPSLIPLFVCPIQNGPGQTNPQLTPFAVTLSYNGNDYEQYVIYQPSNDRSPTRAPSSNPPNYFQVQDPYYYIYSVNQFINMVNVALDSAFTSLKAANPDILQTEAPYFSYDGNSELISLTCQYSYISSNDTPLLVYLNTALHKYFDAFEYIFSPINNNNKDYQFVIRDNKNNWYTDPAETITSPPAYLRTAQEYVSISNWLDLQGIIITTSQIPIKAEFTPSPADNNANKGNMNSRRIITDFQPSFSSLVDARSIMQFAQTGPYRLIEMTSDTELANFDFQVYWIDRYLSYYPLTIPPGYSASFKFMFVRKDTIFA